MVTHPRVAPRVCFSTGSHMLSEMLLQPIGVFDSGLGGLTVLSALIKALPQEDFVYLGDTARVPYGARSEHIVQRYSLENVSFLLKHRVKVVVIACNTATAHAEALIRSQFPNLPVIGVIQPGWMLYLQKPKVQEWG